MRHGKHKFQLGVKKEHRLALMANLASALITHGRIQTTLSKAKALRPFIEKIITLAKKAASTEDKIKKLHFRRLAIARVRNVEAIAKLFDERAQEFLNRPGGYSRIYKLVPRRGDAAPMAIIELIAADDQGYSKKRKKKSSSAKTTSPKAKSSEPKNDEDSAQTHEPIAAASEKE